MIKWLVIFLLNSFTAGTDVNTDEIVNVIVPKVIVQAGKNSSIIVSIEVKDGYHIQAHEVKDEFIIPTTLEIDGNNEFIIRKQIFPASRKFRLEGTDDYLEVYDGRFEIRTLFTATKKIQKKKHHLKGKLNYQACDSLRCYAPRAVEFFVEVDIR